jgi:RNA polymerase sigma-70 factor (ECF subfamily)
MGANATPNRAVTLGHVAQNFAPAMSPSPVEFSSVYDSYRVRIFSQCLYMMRNRGDAEDAAQEVYLQLYKKVHTFRGESKFSTWLHRLTTNCVLMEMRKKRRRWHETNPDDVPMAMHDGDESPDGALDHFPAKGTPFFESVNISTAVSQLPVGFQRIFRLHDVEGYTHSEIADQLKIQIGTSKSQLHKARLRLRRLLQNSRVSTEIH